MPPSTLSASSAASSNSLTPTASNPPSNSNPKQNYKLKYARNLNPINSTAADNITATSADNAPSDNIDIDNNTNNLTINTKPTLSSDDSPNNNPNINNDPNTNTNTNSSDPNNTKTNTTINANINENSNDNNNDNNNSNNNNNNDNSNDNNNSNSNQINDSIGFINFINFNQDGSCCSIGTKSGYKIFSCSPFGKCYTKKIGAIGIIEMLFSSSLLAIVGLGDQPNMSPRRLKLINTKKNLIICELTFPTTILSVKLNKLRLIVLLEDQIYVYNITNMKLLHIIDIPPNPNGIIALSPSIQNNYLAYPSPPRTLSSTNPLGSNNIMNNQNNHNNLSNSILLNHNLNNNLNNSINNNNNDSNNSNQKDLKDSNTRTGDVTIFDTKTLQPICVIEAHKASLATITLSSDGLLLATASDKGTIVRVFSIETGEKLYQFRRGTYGTTIYSLSFSNDNKFLTASSATETVHIFRLGQEELNNTKYLSNDYSSPANLSNNVSINSINSINSISSTKSNSTSNSINSSYSKQNNSHNHTDNDNESNDPNINNNTHDNIDDHLYTNGDSNIKSKNITANDMNDNDNQNNDNNDQNNLDLPRRSSVSSYGSLGSIDVIESSNDLDSLNPTAMANINPSNNTQILKSTKPIIDSSRRTVGRIIRQSSQSLGRKAAEKMGIYLPRRVKSVLKPTRHFASLKLPASNGTKSVVAIGKEISKNIILSNFLINPANGQANGNAPNLNNTINSTNTKNPSNDSSLALNSSESKIVDLLHVMVITSEGIFYNYGLDPKRGGDCILLNQYSLISAGNSERK
ncbi:phosphoinositide binding protein ATG18 [Ascoidea rubescens DSM 1968]|uniref:WD40 repeat-like protein n=1 Tax=Ascoidea rubescens DSM 1968 TaxID=1344418 RepID=A0A1D2VJA9_9ASCO|nr:WD40 repeat-like protein [Ascoidea rubescens DSM 1968]ODV61706.1 WD40 repeat-like protein [Ascoidea rubescens DSM 1968]